MPQQSHLKGNGLLVGVVALSLCLAACSGGGFDIPGGGQPIATAASITNNLTGTQAQALVGAEAVVRIDFSVATAAARDYAIEFRFFFDDNLNGQRDPGEAEVLMTKVSAALESQLPTMSVSNPFTPSTSGNFSGTFFWQAGLDLGFVGTGGNVTTGAGSRLCVRVVPVDVDTTTPNEVAALACNVVYNAGVASVNTTGGSIGPGGVVGNPGRARHTANGLGGTGSTAEIAVAGGIGGAGSGGNNLDRFTINLDNRTHTVSSVGNAQNQRVEHASAPYFVDGDIASVRVLVTGGRDYTSGSPSSGPNASADIIFFDQNGVISEMVVPAGLLGMMNESRAGHSASWLPNNTVLIAGGDGSDPASAEIYDPLADTFTPTAAMPFARADHTATLLPDGRVLVAGGRNPASPTTPLSAVFYNRDGSWSTDTSGTLDRYGHSATKLVNGAVYLIGGRQVTDDTPINSALAFRPFDVRDSGGANVLFPAGFSTIVPAAITPMDPMVSFRAGHSATRLGSGAVLVVGGFDSTETAQNGVEVFIPEAFTANTLGVFSAITPSLLDSRALSSATTTQTGSAVVVGGVTGSSAATPPAVLNTIEVFQFTNTAPKASNVTVTGSLPDVSISFSLTDSENDRAFVIVRFSVDGGPFRFASLTDFAATVNLAPGSYALNWRAGLDGVMAGQSVQVEVIPVGGVFGTPATGTRSF